ncbi:MAG: SdpI family protein [Spirochaetia bacterium]|nr:SdpI family protein [Spirochaetia bacterium]
MKRPTIIHLLSTLTALSIIATAAVYSSLPEMIPTSWDASGIIDTLKPRTHLILTALLPALFIFLLVKVPSINLESESYRQHTRLYTVASLLLVAFLLIIHWFSILASLGTFLQTHILIQLMISLLFIITGFMIPGSDQNSRFSLRTPWTLEHAQVQRRTQKLAGKAFIISGIITGMAVILEPTAAFWVVTAAVAGLILFIYVSSYILYRNAENDEKP